MPEPMPEPPNHVREFCVDVETIYDVETDASSPSLRELVDENQALRKELDKTKRDKEDMSRQIMALQLDRVITAVKETCLALQLGIMPLLGRSMLEAAFRFCRAQCVL